MISVDSTDSTAEIQREKAERDGQVSLLPTLIQRNRTKANS